MPSTLFGGGLVGAESAASSSTWKWLLLGGAVVLLAMNSESFLTLVAIGSLGYVGYKFVTFAITETEG